MSFRIALLAVGLTWLLLRVVYFNGYYTEDAPGYVTDAIYIALGNYHARDHVNGLNIGTYGPVALPIWLLGKREVALSLWPLVCSLLGVASMAALAAFAFGRWLGVLAALLYATYPGDIFFSTVVMPDAPQAGWVTAAVLLVFVAFARPAAQRSWILAGAGAAMGICHLIRANDAILLPVGVAAVAICGRLWTRDAAAAQARSVAAFLAGCGFVYGLEGLAYLWATGDFFHRFHVVTSHYGTLSSIADKGLNTDPRTLPYSLFPPLLWWRQGGWGRLNQDQAYHGLLFCAAAASLVAIAAAVAVRRIRPGNPGNPGSPGSTGRIASAALAIAAFWFVWPLAYHQFGTQSLIAYVPMHRLSRHFVVYAPGAIFAVVAGCYAIGGAAWRDRAWRGAVAAVGAALLVLHLNMNWQGEAIAYDAYQRIKGTYGRIRAALPRDVQTIVGDPGDLCFFDFWLNPLGRENVRVVPFVNYSHCGQIGRSVVLTYSNPGWDQLSAPIIRETVARLPCLISPPAGWQLLYEGHPEKVYVIGKHEAREWTQDTRRLAR